MVANEIEKPKDRSLKPYLNGYPLEATATKRGLSTIKVAEQIGASPFKYRESEYGRTIRGEPYEKLSFVLGVSLSELHLGEKFIRNEAVRIVNNIENDLMKLRIEILKVI